MPATYAQSRADLIQAFIPRAQAFAELIRNRHHQAWSERWTDIKRYHPQKMDFGHIGDTFPVHHAEFTTSEIPGGSEGIKIWFNPWCYVAFYNIRQRVGADVKVHRSPAQLLRKVPLGAQKIPAANNTDDDQPFSKEFEKVDGKGGATDLGVKASTTFRQLIAAGGEAASFKSETEITVAVEASANVNQWYSTTLGDKTGWDGVVPAHTRRIVSRLIEVGRYRQQVTIDGELDYSVRILSRGDFDVNFDGRDDLAAVLSGVGNTGKGGHFSDWARAYSRHPLAPGSGWGQMDWWVDRIAGPVCAQVIEFDEADQASEEHFSWDDEYLPGHPKYEAS